jgi:hypothetical protein
MAKPNKARHFVGKEGRGLCDWNRKGDSKIVSLKWNAGNPEHDVQEP